MKACHYIYKHYKWHCLYSSILAWCWYPRAWFKACLQTNEQDEQSCLLLMSLFPRGFWLYQTTLPSLRCDLHQYPTHPISKHGRWGSHVFSESYRLTVPVSGHRDHHWKDEDQYYTVHTWFSNLRALQCHYWPETVNWNCIISVLGDYGQWCAWPPAGLLTGTAL